MSEQSVESLYSDIRKYFHDSLCNGLLWGKYAVCEGERVSQKLLNEIDETAKELSDAFWEDVAVHVLLDEMLNEEHERRYSEGLDDGFYLDREPLMSWISYKSRSLYGKDDEDVPIDEYDPMDILDQCDISVMSCLYPLIVYYVLKYSSVPEDVESIRYNVDASLLSLFFGESGDYKNKDVMETVLAEMVRLIGKKPNDKKVLSQAKELKEIIFENGHTFKDVHEFHRAFAELLRIFMDETSKRAKSVKADTNKFSKLVSNFQMMDQMKLSMYQGECVLYGMELITGWADYVFYCQCPNFSRLDYYGIALKAKIMEISLNVNETLGTGETPDTNDECENGEYEDAPLEGRFWLNIKERKDKIVSILSQIQHEGLENYFSFYTEAWDRLLSWDEAARGFKYECVKHPVINQIIRVGAFGQRRDLCNYLIRYYELSLANEEDLYDVDLEEDPYEKRNL